MTAQLFDKAGGSGASLFAVFHIRKEESANVCVLEAFCAALSGADNLRDMDKIGRPDMKGIIEQHFRTINTETTVFLPG